MHQIFERSDLEPNEETVLVDSHVSILTDLQSRVRECCGGTDESYSIPHTIALTILAQTRLGESISHISVTDRGIETSRMQVQVRVVR